MPILTGPCAYPEGPSQELRVSGLPRGALKGEFGRRLANGTDRRAGEGMADRRRSSGQRRMSDAPDQVPDEVVAQAKSAFQQRARGEVAVLVFDSVIDESTPNTEQRLRFEHPRMRVEAFVSPTNGECVIRGRVEPAPVRVELEIEGRDVALVEDARSGNFVFPRVPRVLSRMILIGPDGSEPVYTDWFRA